MVKCVQPDDRNDHHHVRSLNLNTRETCFWLSVKIEEAKEENEQENQDVNHVHQVNCFLNGFFEDVRDVHNTHYDDVETLLLYPPAKKTECRLSCC